MRMQLLVLCTLGVVGNAATQFEVTASGPVLAAVYLEGRGPYRFLLDTGSETNLLDSKFAAKLGIRPKSTTKLITAAGSTSVGKVRALTVSLDSAVAEDQHFILTELPGLRERSPDIRGILGQEFLRNFDYMLDFKRRHLSFGQVSEQAGRIPFRLIRGRMAIPTNLGNMILDSGVVIAILFRAPQWRTGSADLTVATGKTVTLTADWGPRLLIGDRAYPLEKVVYQLRDSSLGDGLLPATTFRTIYVSNSDGRDRAALRVCI